MLKNLGIVGVVVSNITPKVTQMCKEYGVETVQVPLHITQPEPEHVQQMINEGIVPCLKWVPPREAYLEMDRYVDWIHEQMDKYPGVIFWDIGGEPETNREQPGCRWDEGPSEFYEFMNAVITQEIAADRFMMGAGFLSATFNGLIGNENRSDFVKRLFADTEYGNLLKAVSVNQYCYGYGGEQNILQGYITMNGITGFKDMIVAEIGVPSAGDLRQLHIIQTPRQQAESLVKCYVCSLVAGYDTIYWYKFFSGGWGIFDNQWNPKPAARALMFLSNLLNRRELVSARQLRALPCDERHMTDHIEWYQFELRSGWLNVIWSKVVPSSTLSRKVPKNAEVQDVYGNVYNGSFIINASPLLILTVNKDDLGRLE